MKIYSGRESFWRVLGLNMWFAQGDSMKRWFPFLFAPVFAVFLLGAGVHWPASAQQAASPHLLRASLEGGRVAVFDTSKDSCELIDIPDAPARAFRDASGTVHLVSSHYIMRSSLGPTLESVKHSCHVDYDSHHDPNPAHFDDSTWLDSFFSLDGHTVIALGHMEYHGWEHPDECKQNTYTSACWYNADTFHLSQDDGYHFGSIKAPENFAVGLPFKYQVNQGPEGYSVDTNIVKAGGWYYAMVTDWNWPPNCSETGGPHPCLVPFGGSPIRTSDILDPSSWRGWGGRNFSVKFVDPYGGPVSHPAKHIYAPVPYMYYVDAISIHEPSHLFVATLCDPFNAAYGPEGIYLSTSPDLVHWTKPILLVTMHQLRSKEPKGSWSYAYASLLDPRSTSRNFSTITDSPYLYYVRFDNNHPPYVRVLFRQRIQLTWN
jgi:hypothetical protein